MSLVQLNTQTDAKTGAKTPLQSKLEEQIEGEVRFDKITRALYSTDASVYQIEPIGVVIPKTRDDIIRAAAICRRHNTSITMRGGGLIFLT